MTVRGGVLSLCNVMENLVWMKSSFIYTREYQSRIATYCTYLPITSYPP